MTGSEERGRTRSVHSGREGYRSRRAAKRRARRRAMVRAALIAIVVLGVVGGGVFIGMRMLQPRTGTTSVSATTVGSTSVPGERSAGVLLVVAQDASTAALAYIAASDSPSILLAFPAATLVSAEGGFATLNDVEAASGVGALGASLTSLLGRTSETTVAVPWAALREAAVTIGKGGTLPPALGGENAADAVLEALSALAAGAKTAKGREALTALPLSGEGAGVARAAIRDLPSPPDVESVMPGKWVGAGQASYFEPDPDKLALLLGQGPASTVSVEVQNGSGELGVAEAATEVISTLGLTMLEPRNAEEFPDVAETQILAAPGTMAHAERIRALLKVGRVVEQKTLPAGRIVVVIGKDLKASSLPSPAG